MGVAIITAGLIVALTASALLVMDVIGSGPAVALGILGIGLIAVSGRWLRSTPCEKPPAESIEQILQTIYSPDRQVRALVRKHASGNYRVEIQKSVHEYLTDIGWQDRWESESNATITDTLATAIEIAARSIGAGSDDFFGDQA
jgi:hypothetical protein